jgi:hypothetical protein
MFNPSGTLEISMKPAALGFRVHSGWTALAAVSVDNGSPCVLARGRPHLVETFTYKFRQPYHTAAVLPFDKASEFISQVQNQARELAYRAINEVQSSVQKRGFQLSQAALLLASGKQLPALDKILASHALIHTADGELFRDALLHASSRCRLSTVCVKEKELLDRAGETFRLKPDTLLRRVTELGRPHSSPWTQDEKLATLIAWLSLASPSNKSGA